MGCLDGRALPDARRLLVLTGLMILVLAGTILGSVLYTVWQLDASLTEAELQRARMALRSEYVPAYSEERLADVLANGYGLAGAHFGMADGVTADEVAVPMPGGGDRLLIWTPRRFGAELFGQLAPMRIGTSLLFVACIMLLMRRLYLVAKELEGRRREAHALAARDPLTGLGNRLAFDQQMARALAKGGEATLFYLDLDGFKQVNDTFGHGAGDDVLRVVGQRLGRLGGMNDLVVRLGGDEFAVVHTGAMDREGLADFALSIESALAEPIMLGTNPLRVGASIGIATAPPDGQTATQLMQAADVALYRAKRDGTGFIVAA